MLKLIPSLTNDLLSQAESGMGYQIVEAEMENHTLKRGTVFNGEVLLFDDESFGDFAKHFRAFAYYDTALEVLRSSWQEGVKTLRVLTEAGTHQPAISVKESSAEYEKYTGGAADAPCEETKAGDAFRRFSAFPNDKRIKADGSVYPGTYATTAEDGDKVKTGLEAVERYALPNPMPASYRFAIQPDKDTLIKKGIAQPAYGHRGDGAEVIFVDGTQPKTVTEMKRLPDK